MGVLLSDDQLRSMYATGRGNTAARRFARFWAAVQGAGLMPRRWVTLEVRGRRSGRTTRFPLGMADVDGAWYLVSMLGECDWVRNVRAASGSATLRRGRSRPVELTEVPVGQRAEILRRYLAKVPGGRPHIAADRDTPLEELERVAADHPTFRVAYLDTVARRRWLWWGLGALVVVIVAAVGATAASVTMVTNPDPLVLPAPAAAPTGAIDGDWAVGAGSEAGFRIDQHVLGVTGEVVGRTTDVSGTVRATADAFTAAEIRIGLTSFTSGDGDDAPQMSENLDADTHPEATLTLSGPVPFDDAFLGGEPVTVEVAGELTLHGVTGPVALTLDLVRDGEAVLAAGSVPVGLDDWSLAVPAGAGFLGELDDHGTAELLLVLERGWPPRPPDRPDRLVRSTGSLSGRRSSPR